jgi:uncharacterized beta-barrel protein YwiB (DUF1934 family)
LNLFIIILQDKGDLMKKKKAQEVIISQTSLSSNETSEKRVLIQYYEEVNQTISFMYKEDDDYRVYVSLDSNQLACMRLGESNTFCWFVYDTQTPLLKDGEVGTIQLTTHTTSYEYKKDVATLKYDLYTDQEKIDTITMNWEIIIR